MEHNPPRPLEIFTGTTPLPLIEYRQTICFRIARSLRIRLNFRDAKGSMLSRFGSIPREIAVRTVVFFSLNDRHWPWRAALTTAQGKALAANGNAGPHALATLSHE